MELNAFHDLVAAITAYLSLLEHDLVLALAFSGFDPSTEISRRDRVTMGREVQTRARRGQGSVALP